MFSNAFQKIFSCFSLNGKNIFLTIFRTNKGTKIKVQINLSIGFNIKYHRIFAFAILGSLAKELKGYM